MLIVGCWVFFKGVLLYDQLLQFLLVYVGIVVDIVEFYEVFNEEVVSVFLNYMYFYRKYKIKEVCGEI